MESLLTGYAIHFSTFFFLTFDWDQLAKIRQHRRKERLNVGNDVKFYSDLLKTNEDIALQSSRIYRRLCSGVGGGLGEGVGARLCLSF